MNLWLTSALSLILVFMGCGHSQQQPSTQKGQMTFEDLSGAQIQKVLSDESHSYHITQGCDSGLRLFQSESELCLNLLVDENNHGCTKDQRTPTYNAHCAGQSWEPNNDDIKAYYYGAGPYAYCVLSDGSKQIEQASRQNLMVMKLGRSKALVRQFDSGDGKMQLLIQLFDHRGQLIDQKEQGFANGKANLFDNLKIQKGDTSLMCFPHLQHLATR